MACLHEAPSVAAATPSPSPGGQVSAACEHRGPVADRVGNEVSGEACEGAQGLVVSTLGAHSSDLLSVLVLDPKVSMRGIPLHAAHPPLVLRASMGPRTFKGSGR